jgi:hypothetical protein
MSSIGGEDSDPLEDVGTRDIDSAMLPRFVEQDAVCRTNSIDLKFFAEETRSPPEYLVQGGC